MSFDPSNLTDEEQLVARDAVARHRVAKLAEVLGDDAARVFGARQNNDLTEGKAGSGVRGWFFLEAEAERATGYLEGVFGRANVDAVAESRVYSSADEWLVAVGQNYSLSESGRARLAEIGEAGVASGSRLG